MKRIFAILAAVLLTSVCAMAQSNDATPLKGDVNGDGMVDVADIVAVIDVMEKGGGGGEEPEPTYTWYQGMGTEEEIQTQSYIDGLSYNQVTKPANDSALTLSRGYNVLIFPSSWGTPPFGGTADYSKQFEPYTADELNIENPSDKTVFVIEAASDGIAYIKFNYNVEEPEPTYYWYVGTTKPTSLDQCEVISEYPAEQNYTNNSGAKSHIFVLTNEDKNVTFINPELHVPIDQMEIDTITIPGYNIFETAVGLANTSEIIIRISGLSSSSY